MEELGTRKMTQGQGAQRAPLLLIAGVILALVIILAAPLLELSVTAEGVQPQDVAGTIEILPNPASVGDGGTTTVYVWLEGVENYYGLDFKLYFDQTLVNIPSGKVTPLWDVFDQGNSFAIKNEVDNVAGTVWYAITNINPAQPFTGTGRICSITFIGLEPGTSNLDLYYAKGANREGGSMYPAQVDGSIVVQGPTEAYRLYLPLILLQ